jgi:glycosyltransferase involved in cell wall biosynthesis
MKLGIVISTYKRPDGTTPQLLSRALQSISTQTYSDYRVYLIGDCYEDSEEFLKLGTSILPPDKIKFYNLKKAVERSKYRVGSEELWCAGGVAATNFGIEKCLEDSIDFICHLDHDDYWNSNHLEVIANVIRLHPEAKFIHTCGTYFASYLPRVNVLDSTVVNQMPRPSGVIHSSTCINFKALNIRYRDVYALRRKLMPADADMWTQINQSAELEECFLIKNLTCYHPTEKQ